MNRFFLYSCTKFIYFLHDFLDLLCSNKLSFPGFLALDNLWSNDPPIHIWSTYLASYRYFQDPFLYLRELMEKLVFLCTLSFLYWFNHFLVGCDTSQWLHRDWEKFSLSVSLTQLSKFKWSIFEADIENNFWSTKFAFLLNFAWWRYLIIVSFPLLEIV